MSLFRRTSSGTSAPVKWKRNTTGGLTIPLTVNGMGGTGGGGTTPPPGGGGGGGGGTTVTKITSVNIGGTFNDTGIDPDAGSANPIVEASGLVCSKKNSTSSAKVFWTHNDSGGTPEIFAIDNSSPYTVLGRWTIGGATNQDWEDIAIGPGPDPNKSYIYIADIGSAAGSTRAIYRVEEPTVAPNASLGSLTIPAANVTTINFTVPTTAVDSEGFFVDPISGDGFFIRKYGSSQTTPTARPQLTMTYRLAGLRNVAQGATTTVTLEELTAIETLTQSEQNNGITAADISSDGLLIVMKNYAEIYAWIRDPGQTVAQTWAAKPKADVHVYYGSAAVNEALAIDPDETRLWGLAEGSAKTLTWVSLGITRTTTTTGGGGGTTTEIRPMTSISSTITTIGDPDPTGAIDTASGFAVSRKNSGVLWVHNDSGHASPTGTEDQPRVFAVKTTSPGVLLRNSVLTGAGDVKNDDFEDMGRCVIDGVHYIYIADIGEQGELVDATRGSQREILRFVEPTVDPNSTTTNTSSIPVEVFTFTRPTSSSNPGSKDMEAMIVDPRPGPGLGDVYLFQKVGGTTTRPRYSSVWRAPASQFVSGGGAVTFTEIKNDLLTLDQSIDNNGGINKADISENGDHILISNYEEVWVYNRAAGQTIQQALNTTPIYRFFGGTTVSNEAFSFDVGSAPAKGYMMGESATSTLRSMSFTYADPVTPPPPTTEYVGGVNGRMIPKPDPVLWGSTPNFVETWDNLTRWNRRTGTVGNNLAQYSHAMVSTSGNELTIDSIWNGGAYTTGDVQTYPGTETGRHFITDGRYFRFAFWGRIPTVEGWWPCNLWFRPIINATRASNGSYTGGSTSDGEIDVLETYGLKGPDHPLAAAIHGNYTDSPHKHVTLRPYNFSALANSNSNDWHYYVVEKTPNKLQMFVDGLNYATFTSSTTNSVWTPTDWANYVENPAYDWGVRITIQIGTAAAGYPTASSPWGTDLVRLKCGPLYGWKYQLAS